MKRLVVAVTVVLVTALVGVAVALADTDTVDPTCNGGDVGSCDGWFNSANSDGSVELSWQISPAPDTAPGCDDQTISTQGVTHLVCDVTWPDTTETKKPVDVKIDTVPPTDVPALSRPPDSNGWYNHSVALDMSGSSDQASGIAPGSCTILSYNGPDALGASMSGHCSDVAGNVGSDAVTGAFNYDSTPPAVRVTPNRPPDHDGWYNHPVSFRVTGADGLSGVRSCAGNPTYSGPQSAAATVVGSCTDNAGNVGVADATLRYDSVRPDSPAVQVTPGNHRVDVSWVAPSDARTVTLVRTQQGSSAAPKVIYAGTRNSFVDKRLRNGTKYAYTVADIDQAGNSTTKTVRAIPTASSLRPYVGSTVSSPPLLTWKKVKRARYYNVQLWFGRTKVLSKWPRAASLQLGTKWHFRGKTHTLLPGHYRWYVWPGYGPLSAHDYGHRIGRSSFRVTG